MVYALWVAVRSTHASGFNSGFHMSCYKRWMLPGSTYFFTLVTYERRPIFDEETVPLLGKVLREVRASYPFSTLAMVVLPDHLHCVWSLPSVDADFSTRWKIIKRKFTFLWLRLGANDVEVSQARRERGEHGVWQRRFWEHLVRDEQDLERCCDYIHFNPVKHGLATRPGAWRWSTFSRFVRAGDYAPDWGLAEPRSFTNGFDGLGE
jgi:putative transposase